MSEPVRNRHVREETPAFVGQVFWAGTRFWRVIPPTNRGGDGLLGFVRLDTEPIA